ncbi:WGR domain-containing protein [Pseudonocardia sp. GCM10023141]|uniref:WGR domain-containing protein n=1 Tax=Pseudonocardia sp. GCM10023141 TaxID=3252653 RepID=UPI0036244E69
MAVVHLEFVSGGSAKFWTAEVHGVEVRGAEVVIDWGPIGGRSQQTVKTFDDEPTAVAFVEKAARAKERKGYVRASRAPLPPRPPGIHTPEPLPLPPFSRAGAVPRRDRNPEPARPPIRWAASTLHTSVERMRGLIGTALAGDDADAALVAAAQAHLDGVPSPLGAAVVHHIVCLAAWQNGEPELAATADAWMADHGVAFAAAATAELAGITTAAGSTPFAPQRAPSDQPLTTDWPGRLFLRRVRHVLAVAAEEHYEAAVRGLGATRHSYAQRAVAAFLVPTEQEWVESACGEAAAHGPGAEDPLVALLLMSVSTVAQFDRLHSVIPGWFPSGRPGMLASLLDGAGPDIAPRLRPWLSTLSTDCAGGLLGLLVGLPTDDAFRAVIELAGSPWAPAALRAATQHHPERAVRLLAEAIANDARGHERLTPVLRSVLYRQPEAMRAVVPGLPLRSRAVVLALAARGGSAVPDATAEHLPRVLVHPPWSRPHRKRPLVVRGLVAAVPHVEVWAAGERAEWAHTLLERGHYPDSTDWPLELHRLRAGELAADDAFELLASAPVELLRPLLPAVRWTPGVAPGGAVSRRVAARLGLDAVPVLEAAAHQQPGAAAAGLVPFLTREIALLMADWLVRTPALRPTATRYFARHGPDTARALVPPALERAVAERRSAEAALRVVAAHRGADAVIAIAAEFGPTAAAGIAAMLATDPIDVLPATVPAVAGWADPAELPRLPLRDGSGQVPVEVVEHLITAFALCLPGSPYAGAEQIRAACDPAALAELGWALFLQWSAAGMAADDAWVLTALEVIGNDDTVRRLAPLVNTWTGKGGHTRAAAGIEVLAAIGSDAALQELGRLASTASSTALRTRAAERITQITAERALAAEQLG